MTRRMYWGLAILVILVVIATVWVVLHDRAYIQQLEQEIVETKQRQQRNLDNRVTVVVPPTEQAAPKEHVHADGTFHEGEHPEPVEAPPADVTVSRDYTPVKVQIPEGITDPDVLAAWERVEYIANNIWEWGGVPSPETSALIAQLMPPPDGFSGPTGHSDAEETIDMLGQLDRNDPRSAEVMAAYFCEGRVGGLGPIYALAEMGPPVVPYLLNYLFSNPEDEVLMMLISNPISALGEIAVKHREDIPGIVDHIIIPKFEELVTDYRYEYVVRYYAEEALANLK